MLSKALIVSLSEMLLACAWHFKWQHNKTTTTCNRMWELMRSSCCGNLLHRIENPNVCLMTETCSLAKVICACGNKFHIISQKGNTPVLLGFPLLFFHVFFLMLHPLRSPERKSGKHQPGGKQSEQSPFSEQVPGQGRYSASSGSSLLSNTTSPTRFNR